MYSFAVYGASPKGKQASRFTAGSSLVRYCLVGLIQRPSMNAIEKATEVASNNLTALKPAVKPLAYLPFGLAS